jgi:chromate transporter
MLTPQITRFKTAIEGRNTEVAAAPAAESAKRAVSQGDLFVSGLRGGLLTFGGAYTAIPFLQRDAVERGGWMTNPEFLDGVALSGTLPAPLIIFSTFVGYMGGGALGALVMTLGIFLPAFSFSLLFHTQLERLMEGSSMRELLEGVTAGVVGIIVSTLITLGVSTITNIKALIIVAAALVPLYLWKSKAVIPTVILSAGLMGWFLFRG